MDLVGDGVVYRSVGDMDLSDGRVVVKKGGKLTVQLLGMLGGADGSIEANNTLNVELCESIQQLVILVVDQ